MFSKGNTKRLQNIFMIKTSDHCIDPTQKTLFFISLKLEYSRFLRVKIKYKVILQLIILLRFCKRNICND